MESGRERMGLRQETRKEAERAGGRGRDGERRCKVCAEGKERALKSVRRECGGARLQNGEKRIKITQERNRDRLIKAGARDMVGAAS